MTVMTVFKMILITKWKLIVKRSLHCSKDVVNIKEIKISRRNVLIGIKLRMT